MIEESDLTPFFRDLTQSEKNSEIKPTLMLIQKMLSPNCGEAQMWDQTLWLSRKWTMCTNWHCQKGKEGLFEEGLIYLWIDPEHFVWKRIEIMVQQQIPILQTFQQIQISLEKLGV